ncbi:MAG TPA: alanine--tRNA ligase-related protein, partial [Terriglobia bacterium]|nr:alanine--tRNA ligase-related protein [Terriglobia bacterium]
MTVSEIRQKYIDFFKSRAHVILPSASLVPENDPTTLFTGSGMQPMV